MSPGKQVAIICLALIALLSGAIVGASPPPARKTQQRSDESPAVVRFELPASVEMQERAGLIVPGTFIGRDGTPTWIVKPSGEWIQILLRDTSGKLLFDRRLWPYAPGREPDVTPMAVYGRLGFPFEALPRCEVLRPGRYNLEIRYQSPATDRAIAVSHTAALTLTVRTNKAVPLRHLSLEVPEHVVHDDFRRPEFGVYIRVVNDGCETQHIVPFASDSVSVEARAANGRVVPCRPAIARSASAPIAVPAVQVWQTFVPFSGRCDIPLPSGAAERSRYRVRVSYRGPGWTGAPLQLDRTIELELANLPHSFPTLPRAVPDDRVPDKD
jgi:hypothetical protein